MPLGIVERLWRETGDFEEIDSEDFLNKLFRLSLVSELDFERRTFRLHDVMRSYLLTRVGNQNLCLLHGKLVGALKREADANADSIWLAEVYVYLANCERDLGRKSSARELLAKASAIHAAQAPLGGFLTRALDGLRASLAS